jgi:hypothetical protein
MIFLVLILDIKPCQIEDQNQHLKGHRALSGKTKLEEVKNYFKDFGAQTWNWRCRNLENIVDDPIDNLKHKIHGTNVFGYTIYLPKWLMKGSEEKK